MDSLLIQQLLKTVYILLFGYALRFICKAQDKRSKEHKTWRKFMENSYDAIKSGILIVEHAAMVVAGAVVGWFVAKKRRKQSQKFLEDMVDEMKKANREQLQYAISQEKEHKEEEVKVIDDRPMPYGKDFVKAIGEVWLYNNFFGRTLKQ